MNEEDVIAATREWLEKAVIGLNLENKNIAVIPPQIAQCARVVTSTPQTKPGVLCETWPPSAKRWR